MNSRLLHAALLLTVSGTAFASLIPLGTVNLTGTGLGSQFTLVTFQETGTESGCVAAGAGGTAITGTSACPPGFTGGDEQAINNVYSAATVGITNFNNLQLIFNANEPQNAGARSITVDNLALTLWNPTDGSLLDAFYIDTPLVIPDAQPGVGKAGFGFGLDATQAAVANSLLAAFPTLRIGAAATASDASGGLETIFVRSSGTPRDVPGIPEPSTYALAISALAGLFSWRKFTKS